MNFRIWISFSSIQFLGPKQVAFVPALRNLLKKTVGWRDSPLAFSSSSKAGALCTRARQQMEPTNSNDDLLILVEKLFRVMFRFFFQNNDDDGHDDFELRTTDSNWRKRKIAGAGKIFFRFARFDKLCGDSDAALDWRAQHCQQHCWLGDYSRISLRIPNETSHIYFASNQSID